MGPEYRLAIFKGLVTFILVGIVGFAIESWHSSSQEKRDRKRVLLEASNNDLSEFGASLSFLRATVSRLPTDQSATGDNLRDYRDAFRQFSESKVPFIIGMKQLGITDKSLISAFGDINESAIKLDRCILGQGGTDCNLEQNFLRFVNLSTEFENNMIQALPTIE